MREIPHISLPEESRAQKLDLRKKHIQISIDKLRDREQIILELVHKSDIIQGEVIIYLDDAGTKQLTHLVIPKSHILLV
jgi:hypothetical protein